MQWIIFVILLLYSYKITADKALETVIPAK